MGSTILITALTLALVALVTVSVLVALLARAAVRHNRVHPAIETGVPLRWSWSPGTAARAHRRLRAAVHDIALPPRRPGHRRAGPVPPVGSLGPALVGQAVAVDRELLVAAHLRSPAHRALLRGLRADVAHIERLGRAYRREGPAAAASPLPPCGSGRQSVLDAVELRLHHLHEAHAELRAVEAETAPEHLARLVPAYPPSSPAPSAPRHAA